MPQVSWLEVFLLLFFGKEDEQNLPNSNEQNVVIAILLTCLQKNFSVQLSLNSWSKTCKQECVESYSFCSLHTQERMATLLVPVYFVLNILSWFSMFSAFRTTILSHYQVVLFCCWAYQWTYSQVGAWWPTYSITPTLHYSISVCLTFHIYPLTSSGRILTCRSLNLKVCLCQVALTVKPVSLSSYTGQ